MAHAHAHPPHTDLAGEHGEHHVLQPSVYYKVFTALMVLLFVTVWAAEFNLGELNVAIAVTIAVVKALLIILYFMHMRFNSRLTWIFGAAAFFWLGIMFVLALSDYMSRDWQAVPRVGITAPDRLTRSALPAAPHTWPAAGSHPTGRAEPAAPFRSPGGVVSWRQRHGPRLPRPLARENMAISTPRGAGRLKRPVVYPTSDGKPMAETDQHRDLAVYVIEALKARYAGQAVYISGNNVVFFQEGDPKRRVSPDAYVVFGIAMRQRDSYKAWEEGGRLPDVVFEFTSRKTRREDVETKRPLYERVLKVGEYFQFDPTGDYLAPRLQGFRLEDGRHVPLALVDGRLTSQRLGLELVMEGEDLYLQDPRTGERLPTPLELARRAEEEGRRAEREAEGRAAAEVELARLRAELAARRGEPS